MMREELTKAFKMISDTLFQHFNPYSVGIDFSRQILPAKVNSSAVRINIFILAVDP